MRYRALYDSKCIRTQAGEKGEMSVGGGVLQVCAALLKAGVGLPQFQVEVTIATMSLLSMSVPSICLFRLVTYALWCLPQCVSSVFCTPQGTTVT